MNTFEDINQLNHEELLDLLIEYNRYVIEVCDRQDGSVPVCVPEFYDCEYQESLALKNNLYTCLYCETKYDVREGHSCMEMRSRLD